MGLFTQKFDDVEVNTGGSGNATKYIYPGIRHNVTIKKVYSGESSQKKTPFIGIEVYTKEGGPDASKELVLGYLTPAAMPSLQTKLKHIAHAVVTDAEFKEEVDDSSIDALVSSLNTLFKGQTLRMKFSGREYVSPTDGKVKESAQINMPRFAEAIQEGAEYPVVADEDTKLVYDAENKYDLEKLSPSEMPTEEGKLAEDENTVDNIDDII